MRRFSQSPILTGARRRTRGLHHVAGTSLWLQEEVNEDAFVDAAGTPQGL